MYGKHIVIHSHHVTDFTRIDFRAAAVLHRAAYFERVNIENIDSVCGAYIPFVFIHSKESAAVSPAEFGKLLQCLHCGGVAHGESSTLHLDAIGLFCHNEKLAAIDLSCLGGASELHTGVFGLEHAIAPFSAVIKKINRRTVGAIPVFIDYENTL